MRTITVDEAQSELPQVLDEVEAGAEVIIARGEKPIARLVRIADSPGRRPKVGQLRGAPFQIPDAALAPLTPDELKEWDFTSAHAAQHDRVTTRTMIAEVAIGE